MIDREPIVETALRKAAEYRTSCWTPVVREGDGAALASKFSGVAFLREGESWPCCPNCTTPMQLFLQVNSGELPTGVRPFGDGLLQMFYCTNSKPLCEVDCEAFLPFSRSCLIRIVERPLSDTTSETTSPVARAFPPKTITSWTEHTDYPNSDELKLVGADLTEEELESIYDTEYPVVGEKLLGYPYWVQNVEYPSCPKCDKTMKLLFQIDSDSNLPYMFGDCGCGHITQCPDHPDQLAFGWACC